MYPSERKFADYLESKGKNWIYHPRSFRFNGMKYQTDFYCPEDDTYYEVVGTRQAISSLKIKIGDFLMAYPEIKFRIVKPDGKDYFANKILTEEIKKSKVKKEKNNGFWDAFIKQDQIRKDFRQFLNEKDMRLTQAAKLLECSIGAISKFLLGRTTPNERTAYKVRKLIGK